MMSDAELKRMVLAELEWDSRIDHAHIGVTALHGAVTLSGHVTNYPAKWAATDVAKKVNGVKSVGDEIVIDLPRQQRQGDGDIATRVANVLEWSIPEPGKHVKATVRNGFVTLSGQVDWQHQRNEVERQVRHLRGVVGIANQIELKKVPTPRNVSQKIEDALRRNANLEARNVSVSVHEDTVTLDGEVQAEYERELAKNAAWTVPGVRHVVDRIQIA